MSRVGSDVIRESLNAKPNKAATTNLALNIRVFFSNLNPHVALQMSCPYMKDQDVVGEVDEAISSYSSYCIEKIISNSPKRTGIWSARFVSDCCKLDMPTSTHDSVSTSQAHVAIKIPRTHTHN